MSLLIYICSAQSKNRYNSGIVLRKVGISLCPPIPELYRKILELRKGYMLKIDTVCVPVGIAGQSENSSNAEIHFETKQKNVLWGKIKNRLWSNYSVAY